MRACADVCFAIPDALSPDRCGAIVAEATALGFMPTGADYPPSYRNNDRQVRDDPALAAAMFAELQALLPPRLVDDDGVDWTLCRLNERFRICRYRDGQGFRIHRDGAHTASPAERSLLTLQVYLDDGRGFTGGRTRFYATRQGPMELAFEPRTGRAIVFDHQRWHDGEPVTGGTKHVLRTDVIYQRQAAPAAAPGPGTLRGHAGYVLAVLPLADGAIATGSRDRHLKVWRAGPLGWACERTLAGHTASVFALAEDHAGALFSGSRDHTVRRWDRVAGTATVAHRHAGAVLCLAALADGCLASGSGDATIAILGTPDAEPATLVGHRGWVWALAALSADVLVSGSEDGTLRLWHLPDRACCALVAPGRGPVHALARLADDRVAAGFADGHVAIYAVDAGHGTLHEVDAFRAHAGEVYALAAGADGRLASGGEDDLAHIWRLADGACLQSYRHQGFVRAVAWQGADTLVTGAYDGLARLW